MWLGAVVIRNYQKKAAPEQAPILAALEEAGWPSQPVRLPTACWETLHTTLKHINQKIENRIIRVQAAGDGQSVIWVSSQEVP